MLKGELVRDNRTELVCVISSGGLVSVNDRSSSAYVEGGARQRVIGRSPSV